MIQRLYDARKQGFVTREPPKSFELTSVDTRTSDQDRDSKPRGRLLALDLGSKRVGVAVSDELQMTVRPLTAIERRSWKELLLRVKDQIETLGAAGLVIGLPLNLDGSEGAAAREARVTAEKFRLSLSLPVFLQDERLTTEAAKSRLQSLRNQSEIDRQIDSEAAAIILQDFLSLEQP